MSRFRGSVVFYVSVFFFAFLRDAFALPTLLRRQQEHGFDFSKYTVPLSDGPSTLPPPSQPLTLKAITLARGYQNYTCNPTSPPTPAGALATLYDATPLLSRLSCSQPQTPSQPHTQTQAVLNFLTHYLYYFAFPDFLTSSHNQHKTDDKDGDGDDGNGKDAKGRFGIPVIGQHFFDAAQVPTWDLGAAKLGVLKAKKVGGIKSQEAGSVDWLVLESLGYGDAAGGGKKEGGGGGEGSKAVDGGGGGAGAGALKEVYRVETVGGVLLGGECDGKGNGKGEGKGKDGETVRVRYAAQYWFYG